MVICHLIQASELEKFDIDLIALLYNKHPPNKNKNCTIFKSKEESLEDKYLEATNISDDIMQKCIKVSL